LNTLELKRGYDRKG